MTEEEEKLAWNRELDHADRRSLYTVLVVVGLVLLCTVCLLLSSRVHAEPVTLKCTPPTENTDGSLLTDLAGIRWLYGASPASLAPIKDSPGCETTVDVPIGTWYFAAKAFTATGAESVLSNIATKTITPVTLTRKTAATTAYRLNMGYANQIKVERIGSLALDMPCTEPSWNGYHVLPNRMDARIKLDAGKSRPLQVLAKCELRP